MAAQLYQAFVGKPAPAAILCPDCKKEFTDVKQLHSHMLAQMQKKDNGHLHCRECKQYFVEVDDLVAHVKATHIGPTDLACAGCLGRFPHIGDIALHIEAGKCPAISLKKLNEVRERKLKFAQELQKRHFGAYDDSKTKVDATKTSSHLRPKAENTVRPNPVQVVIHEHGKLGSELPSYYGSPKVEQSAKGSHTTQVQRKGSNKTAEKVSLLDDFEEPQPSTAFASLIDLLGDSTENLFENPWSDIKSPRDPDWIDTELLPLSPVNTAAANSKPAVINTKPITAIEKPPQIAPAHPEASAPPKPMAALANFGKPTSFASLHDPKTPGWNAQRYMHPVYQQYKCPMPNCFKTFKKPVQFRHHLEWHTQDAPCEYQCPGCKTMFPALSRLLHHTESNSRRCRFRDSANYNVFLNQAMGGLIDIVDEHGLGGGEKILEFAVPDQAFEDFNPEGRAGRPTEKKMVTAAWEGNHQNDMADRGGDIQTETVKDKIAYDQYEVVHPDIDDAFKNLPELGDKVAPKPAVKFVAGASVKAETGNELVSFSDINAKAKIQQPVRTGNALHVPAVVKSYAKPAKGVSVEDCKLNAAGRGYPVQQVESVHGRTYGLSALRARELAEDSAGNIVGSLPDFDFYIDGKIYEPDDWIIEWCDTDPLFFPRHPDGYRPNWTPVNR